MKKIWTGVLTLLLCQLFFFSAICHGEEKTYQITQIQLIQLKGHLQERKRINQELQVQLESLKEQLRKSNQELQTLKVSTQTLNKQLTELKAYSNEQESLIQKMKESCKKLRKQPRKEISVKVNKNLEGVGYTHTFNVLGSVYGFRGEYDWNDDKFSLWLVYQY